MFGSIKRIDTAIGLTREIREDVALVEAERQADKATISRLTAELAQARAEAAAAYERAEEVARNRESHAKGETARACRGIAVSIGMLSTELSTTALAEMLDAETRACAETIRPRLGPQGNGVIVAELHRQAVAILARIDQRKEAGKCKE